MTDFDLFGGALRPTQSSPKPGKTMSPRRSFAAQGGGSPREAAEALADIRDGRLGVLDNTGRVVRFIDHDQVRHGDNEGVVVALIRSGYVIEDDRGRVSCLHGAIRRPVIPLKLTGPGRVLLERWSALRGTGARRTE
jgi:hypothetical protein